MQKGRATRRNLHFFLKRLLDTSPIPAQSLEKFYHIDGVQLERHYKEHLSDFKSWEAAEHAEEWLLFPENLGKWLSIDETSLSNGELYTIISNKAAGGRKGALVAIVEGTSSETVIEILKKIPQDKRNQVRIPDFRGNQGVTNLNKQVKLVVGNIVSVSLS